ncbi:hypothetical protein PRIPAC_84425, partial [Pristionchus pacificus]|uniref:Uncharacterized protein n=1 Tax=Pristionchus pacificus TaxID=54126 RepID=A0A2A6BKS7_PRIPA
QVLFFLAIVTLTYVTLSESTCATSRLSLPSVMTPIEWLFFYYLSVLFVIWRLLSRGNRSRAGMSSDQPPVLPSSIVVSSISQPSKSSIVHSSGNHRFASFRPDLLSSVSSLPSPFSDESSSSSLPMSSILPVSSAATSIPSIQSSRPFSNSPMSSGVQPSMFHLPTGQSHLDLLVSALKPHFIAPSPISHTIPRVKNGETQEIIASLVEAANEAEKVKVGSGSIDTVISLILERIQVLVVQETSPGFSDSFKKVKALHSLSGGGMDPQLLAAAMTMTASTSNFLPSTSKRLITPLLPSTQNLLASIAMNADTRAPTALFPLEDNRVMSSVDAEFVAKQLIEWLQSGAIVEAKADEELAVYPLTVAKNGYQHLSINAESSKWLGCRWQLEGKVRTFKFQALPFGLSPDTIEELARGVGWIRYDLGQAGTTVNEEKSKFLPSQSGEGGAMMDELEEELKRVGRLDLIETARFAMKRSVAPSTLKAHSTADLNDYPKYLRILHGKSQRASSLSPNSIRAIVLVKRFERALREYSVKVESSVVDSKNTKEFYSLCKSRLNSSNAAPPGIIDLDGSHLLSRRWVLSFSVSRWNLPLNESKCTVVHYGSHSPRTQYLINGIPLAVSPSIKDLGVIMQPSLKFNDHISKIVSKARAKVILLFKCFFSVDPTLYCRAFSTFIKPLLEYRSVVWSPHTVILANNIEDVQRNFTRRLFARCRVPYVLYPERISLLSLSTLEHRRFISDLIFLHKSIHGFYSYDHSNLFKLSPLISFFAHLVTTQYSKVLSLEVLNDGTCFPPNQ